VEHKLGFYFGSAMTSDDIMCEKAIEERVCNVVRVIIETMLLAVYSKW
jgi:hypothetical protein